MASAIDIANMALAFVGDEPIASFSQGNKRARNCTLFFTPARRTALRLGSWNCCSKKTDLPADASSPVWGFSNRYLQPSDFIRLIAVKNAGADFQFTIEGRFLETDLTAPLQIKYVFDDADTTRFDPLLTKVFAYCLALDLVEPLSHSNTKKQEIEKSLTFWLGKASNVDGVERPPQKIKDTSWLRARERG